MSLSLPANFTRLKPKGYRAKVFQQPFCASQCVCMNSMAPAVVAQAIDLVGNFPAAASFALKRFEG
jgi:hypothetical protein